MPSAPRPPVIGLTGGIGAGKSTVAGVLESLGCVVSRSDDDARAALRDPAIRAELVAWWGDDILDPHGAVDRARVAAIVFSDPDERRRLEGLTHPWIERRRRELFDAAPDDCPALVIDAPLLLEVGLDRACDAVIFVDASRATRLERVRATRGWDEAELDRRALSQLPLDVKRKRADHVIQNDGDADGPTGPDHLDQLTETVRAVLRDILDSLQG